MKETKFIVGKLNPETKKATMALYSDIDYWSSRDFMDEFKWLETLGYKEIDILINSVGGSVVEGISIYSQITNSNMKCTTIIEGVAMSMGSIVWAAGDKLKMKDYGILMIHNPFNSSLTDTSEDKDMQVTLNAFREQMKTIYMKRFKMEESEVEKIMDGVDGVDGTFFNPTQAIEAGFIKDEDVLITTPIEKDNLLNKLSDFEGSKLQYAKILAKAVEESGNNKNNTQPKKEEKTIIDKISKTKVVASSTPKEKSKENNMENLSFIVAALELPTDSDVNAVVASLTKLKNDKSSLSKQNKELVEAKVKMETEIAGHKTSIDNLKSSLQTAEESLQVYKDKELEEKNKAIEALVDDAIQAGKITEDARESWVQMANTNLELTESTLNSIEAKKTINEEIVGDAKGVKDAEANKTPYETSISTNIEETDEFKAKMSLLD